MTAAAEVPPVSVDTLLRRSWTLLRTNWVIVAPMLIVAIAFFVLFGGLAVLGIAYGVVSPHGTAASAGGVIALLFLVAIVVGAGLGAVAYDALYGMADAAWTRGTTTLGDGVAAAGARLGDTIVAMVGFVGVVIAAVILALPTLGLVFLALPLVTMYVFPAVVSGGFGGFAAFGESWRLVRRYFGTSAITMLILIAINYLISMVAWVAIVPFEFMAGGSGQGHPTLGAIAALIVVGGIVGIVVMIASLVYTAYYAIALTGLYRWLHARALAEDAALL